MNENEIEAIFEECKEGSSEPCFNLDHGHTTMVDYKRYAELLEHFIRTQLSSKESE